METFTNDKILVQKYSSDFLIPVELAHIVARRFPVYSEAKKFLYPEITSLYDPILIPDIDTATKEIITSIQRGDGILVYSHDDPDGYTSAAIMYKTLVDLRRHKNIPIFVYPIIREKDGYILNPVVLREYKQRGVKLVVTVDFGISSEDNFRIAKEEHLNLIVCDHHETSRTDFPAPAVDPKRPDSKYPFRELAGVGVTFKLAQSLYQTAFNLEPMEFYNLKKEFFALALIGTISDRVILIDENRTFCTHGLKIINRMDDAWVQYFNKDGAINLGQIIKEINPVLASAAYLDPNLGVNMLVSNDETCVSETIAKLKVVNDERRQATRLLYDEAIAAAKTFPGIVISVIPFSKHHYLGPVVSRLKDYFKRTVIVIGLRDEKCFGELRSSCVDLHRMLEHLSYLFSDCGGHKKAAGFSMPRHNLDKFIEQAAAYVAQCSENISHNNSGTRVIPEAKLNKPDVNILTPLTPFGEGNPPPILTDGISMYTINNNLNVVEIQEEK